MKTLSIPPSGETSARPSVGRGARGSRRAYLSLAVLFWIAVVAQAFLAGAGIFVAGSWMAWHEALGHLMSSPIPLIPLLLLILSFTGRLPGTDRWLCGLLLFLTMVQPVMLYFRGVLPLLSAFHPVNALVLFTLPLYLIMRVRRSLRSTAQLNPADQPIQTTLAN